MDEKAAGLAIADLWVQAIIGVGTLIVALAALYVARRTHRTERENFLVAIRREWEELRPDWNRALMYLRGADDYYHEASPKERVAHTKRVARFSSADRMKFNTKSWEWVRDQRATVSKTARFLVYASDALLTGRWTVSEAYALFGPDVARHYDAILWMAHRRSANEVLYASPGGDEAWHASIDQLPEFNFYDSQDALVVLAFVLRAEQCRRGDTHAHFVSWLARDLRGEWSTASKRALWRASRARGRWFPRPSLVNSLHRARYPWKRSGYEFERDAIRSAEVHAPYFRRPYESNRGNLVRIKKLARDAEF